MKNSHVAPDISSITAIIECLEDLPEKYTVKQRKQKGKLHNFVEEEIEHEKEKLVGARVAEINEDLQEHRIKQLLTREDRFQKVLELWNKMKIMNIKPDL